jgi:two-component system chemotaxis response regulator CheY
MQVPDKVEDGMGLKVMVVDDALFMRNMLRGILEEAGCEIIAEAADGMEAVAKYREFRPDITTMDIIMPVKGGIEALNEIMAFDSSARVVMCSAIGQEALVQAAQTAGALDFIIKPFNPEHVVEVIKRAAGN